MSFQIVYQSDEDNPNALHWLFHAEARSMEAAGIAVERHLVRWRSACFTAE